MNIVDYGIVAVIVGLLALAAFAVYRFRKSGKKCIGCPDSCTCSGGCSGCKK